MSLRDTTLAVAAEKWKEIRRIERKAETHEADANATPHSNPRTAQVYATLAVAARLEALTHALQHPWHL